MDDPEDIHVHLHFPDKLVIQLQSPFDNQIQTQLQSIMSQLDDLNTELSTLKTEADAAKVRDIAVQTALTEVQAKLDALIANPTVPDLTSEIQSVKDSVAVIQSIAAVPAPTPPAQ